MVVINFKKWVMTFEKQDIRVIAPMDPQEGRRHIELIKDEDMEDRIMSTISPRTTSTLLSMEK